MTKPILFDRVVLKADLPNTSFKAGDVGTIVEIYNGGKAYKVEFTALDGSILAVKTVDNELVKPVSERMVLHSRELGPTSFRLILKGGSISSASKDFPMQVVPRATEALLAQMSPVEKAQLLQWVVSDLGGIFPGIEKTPGVCGGEARITRTRIPVWLLVQQRHLGLSDEEILHGYPTLQAEDLSNAWNYYRTHKKEIEAQILENEQA